MPRNPSEAQIESSRRNGARSKGPVTPEGKYTVSQNARRLSVSPRRIAESLLLPGESSTALEALVQSILDEHPPANEIELGYVNMAVAAQWRLCRIYAVEQASFLENAAKHPSSSMLDTPDGAWRIPAAQVAKSFKEVHGEKGNASIYQTSESRYGRQYTHALQQWRILQAGREKPASDDPEFLAYQTKTFFRTKMPLTHSID